MHNCFEIYQQIHVSICKLYLEEIWKLSTSVRSPLLLSDSSNSFLTGLSAYYLTRLSQIHSSTAVPGTPLKYKSDHIIIISYYSPV